MNFLKTFLVMLFSLALIGSQSVFELNAALGNPVAGEPSTGCSCSMTECCMKQTSDAPAEPLASVPSESSFQTQQFIAAFCRLVLQQPLTTGERRVVSVYFSPSASAVPLFKRNCTFLI